MNYRSYPDGVAVDAIRSERCIRSGVGSRMGFVEGRLRLCE